MDPSVRAHLLARAARERAGLTLDEDAFVAHVERLCGDRTDAESIDALHAGDLALAWACARGDRRALETFSREHLEPALQIVGRSRGLATHQDDVAADLRMKLLLGENGAAPKIATYAGRGPLGAWVRVAATRAALSLERKKSPDDRGGDEALAQVAVDDELPEIRALRARFGAALEESFAAALRALDADGRSVLRLHVLEGLNVDEIGRIHGIHRATAARWIARAKDDVRALTRKELEARVKLGRVEIDSIVRALDSRIDVSIQRLLGDE